MTIEFVHLKRGKLRGFYITELLRKEHYVCVSSPLDVLIGGIEQSAVITYSFKLTPNYELKIMRILLLVVYAT